MDTSLPYQILAYYFISPIADPQGEVKAHKAFFEGRDIKCRVYISETGINGQMSASNADAKAYMDWMNSKPEFQGVQFKLTPHHEQVFPRLTVKYRKNLVGYDRPIDFSIRGEHVSPERWKKMLENKEEGRILIDVRNDYEWKVGHFDGAELPQCETFRDFDKYAEDLKSKVDPKKTPVMMYCTGGIRCELYSSILMERGFEKVYQLDGGVINYGMKEGTKHWLGKLFVFDDRLVAPVSETEEHTVIGTCHHCGVKGDSYYNCANLKCNTLFICCEDCLPKFSGCCSSDCQGSDRIRPFHHMTTHKPFRRWHTYKDQAQEKKN